MSCSPILPPIYVSSPSNQSCSCSILFETTTPRNYIVFQCKLVSLTRALTLHSLVWLLLHLLHATPLLSTAHPGSSLEVRTWKGKDWSKGSIYRTAYNWIALKQEHSSTLHYDCVYLNKLLLDYTLNIILCLIFNSSLSQHQFCKVLLLSLNVVVKGYKMFSCLDLREIASQHLHGKHGLHTVPASN